MNNDSTRKRWFRLIVLSLSLIGVNLAWFVHFIYSRSAPPSAVWDFWKVWEISSIGATLLVTPFFWASYFKGKSAVFQGTDSGYIASAVLWLILFTVGFSFAGVLAVIELKGLNLGWFGWLTQCTLTLQVVFLVLGVCGVLKLELLALRATFENLKKIKDRLTGGTISEDDAKKISDILNNRDNVSKYLCFGDLPVAFAMLCLALFVACHDLWNPTCDEPQVQSQMRAFVAGAVALQLLYSNFVFWLEAGADTDWGRRRFEKLAVWLRPLRFMFDPGLRKPKNVPLTDWARQELERLFPN